MDPNLSRPIASDPSPTGNKTISQWLTEARRVFSESPIEISPREAFLLLAHVLDWSEAQVRARDDRLLEAEAAGHFQGLLTRRAAGEPSAYLTGIREFFGRELQVDRRVLIPRPETEHLVEATLTRLKDVPSPRVLDVGTGSGCVALTLACELPSARVTATDLSLDALEVARLNARHLNVWDRMSWLRGDLTKACALARFDAVVSNPPYVAEEAAEQMSPEVLDFEPHSALFAADQGRRLIVELLDDARRMKSGAHLCFELGFDQGEWALGEIDARPHLKDGELIRDYAGLSRVVACIRV